MRFLFINDNSCSWPNYVFQMLAYNMMQVIFFNTISLMKEPLSTLKKENSENFLYFYDISSTIYAWPITARCCFSIPPEKIT